MKLTEWFDKGVKPELVGVYEVDDEFGDTRQWYSFWDGNRFCFRSCGGPDWAHDMRSEKTGLPALVRWRGLAEDPNWSKP